MHICMKIRIESVDGGFWRLETWDLTVSQATVYEDSFGVKSKRNYLIAEIRRNHKCYL